MKGYDDGDNSVYTYMYTPMLFDVTGKGHPTSYLLLKMAGILVMFPVSTKPST